MALALALRQSPPPYNPDRPHAVEESEVISAPGVYDLSADGYHADPAPTPSLSSSGMKILLDECPARFWFESRRLNPLASEKRTKALDFGRAAHTWLMQGDEFERTVAVMPAELDLRSNAGKAFAAQAEGEGKTLLRAAEFEIIRAMRNAALRSELARLALSNGRAEPSLFWVDDETGVWLRCRPDWLPTAARFIPDFKTAADCDPRQFGRSVRQFGYHIQAAHYLNGIEAVTGHRPAAFFFVVQEKTPPYLVSICTLDEEAMMWGERLARRAIRIFADCLEKDRWPGYDDRIATVGLPRWASHEYEALDALGHFDNPNEEPAYEHAAE